MSNNNTTATVVNANPSIDSAVVDIKNKGIFKKQTAVSVCGKDVICMPRQAASTAGCGLAIGAGAALVYMGGVVAGKAAHALIGGVGSKVNLKPFQKRVDRGNAGNAGPAATKGGEM